MGCVGAVDITGAHPASNTCRAVCHGGVQLCVSVVAESKCPMAATDQQRKETVSSQEAKVLDIPGDTV